MGQLVLTNTPIKNWRILLDQNFTARTLAVTSAFWLNRCSTFLELLIVLTTLSYTVEYATEMYAVCQKADGYPIKSMIGNCKKKCNEN